MEKASIGLLRVQPSFRIQSGIRAQTQRNRRFAKCMYIPRFTNSPWKASARKIDAIPFSIDAFRASQPAGNEVFHRGQKPAAPPSIYIYIQICEMEEKKKGGGKGERGRYQGKRLECNSIIRTKSTEVLLYEAVIQRDLRSTRTLLTLCSMFRAILDVI